MTKITHGTIILPDKIDITDISYDEDVWCRINNFPIPAGKYECYTLSDTYKGISSRIGIRKPDSFVTRYLRRAMIDSPTGIAGFFNCDNVKIWEEELHKESFNGIYLSDNAFFASSGYKNGTYDIWVGYNHDEIIQVYIDFDHSTIK